MSMEVGDGESSARARGECVWIAGNKAHPPPGEQPSDLSQEVIVDVGLLAAFQTQRFELKPSSIQRKCKSPPSRVAGRHIEATAIEPQAASHVTIRRGRCK